MASGTGNLPYPGKSYTPFDILTAEELNEDVANIESLADGTGIGDGAITTNTLAQSAIDLLGSYSLSEVATPYKWVDGKTIYKKTINFGTLPNATAKAVAHGVSGMDAVINYEVIVTVGVGSYLLIPYAAVTSASANVFPQADRTNVQISAGADRSSWTAYFTIYYTKA